MPLYKVRGWHGGAVVNVASTQLQGPRCNPQVGVLSLRCCACYPYVLVSSGSPVSSQLWKTFFWWIVYTKLPLGINDYGLVLQWSGVPGYIPATCPVFSRPTVTDREKQFLKRRWMNKWGNKLWHSILIYFLVWCYAIWDAVIKWQLCFPNVQYS